MLYTNTEIAVLLALKMTAIWFQIYSIFFLPVIYASQPLSIPDGSNSSPAEHSIYLHLKYSTVPSIICNLYHVQWAISSVSTANLSSIFRLWFGLSYLARNWHWLVSFIPIGILVSRPLCWESLADGYQSSVDLSAFSFHQQSQTQYISIIICIIIHEISFISNRIKCITLTFFYL